VLGGEVGGRDAVFFSEGGKKGVVNGKRIGTNCCKGYKMGRGVTQNAFFLQCKNLCDGLKGGRLKYVCFGGCCEKEGRRKKGRVIKKNT